MTAKLMMATDCAPAVIEAVACAFVPGSLRRADGGGQQVRSSAQFARTPGRTAVSSRSEDLSWGLPRSPAPTADSLT